MEFMRKSSWSFASVSFKAISVLMVNKLFAIFFGTTGITILAHFQNLIGIVTAIPHDGINRGVIKYWSPRSQTTSEKHYLFYSALFLNLVSFLTVILLLFLNGQLFFNEFIFSMDARIFYLSFFGLVLIHFGQIR